MGVQRRISIGWGFGIAAWLLAAAAGLATAAEGPEPAQGPTREGVAPPAGPTREELLREIQRLQDTIRDFQSQIEQVRKSVLPQTTGIVTVPGGARQSTPFNSPAPDFGPSQWVPTWSPQVNPSPQARIRTPRELGALPPPVNVDGPLNFPQYIPSTLAVEHGLGPNPVTVTIAVVNRDGSANVTGHVGVMPGVEVQVDANQVVVTTSSPPNGTFTIANYNEQPITLRWTAQRTPE